MLEAICLAALPLLCEAAETSTKNKTSGTPVAVAGTVFVGAVVAASYMRKVRQSNKESEGVVDLETGRTEQAEPIEQTRTLRKTINTYKEAILSRWNQPSPKLTPKTISSYNAASANPPPGFEKIKNKQKD